MKDVKYKLTSGVGNALHTLPTNYEVYRQVVKAYPQKTPLELTFFEFKMQNSKFKMKRRMEIILN